MDRYFENGKNCNKTTYVVGVKTKRTNTWETVFTRKESDARRYLSRARKNDKCGNEFGLFERRVIQIIERLAE